MISKIQFSNTGKISPGSIHKSYEISFKQTRDLFSYTNNPEFVKQITLKKKNVFNQDVIKADIYKTLSSGKGSETYYLTDSDKNILGEATLKIDEEDIFIANLESYARKKYKGIGTSLIQIAVEKSMEKSHSGKIILNAQKLHLFQRNPKNFYKKIGFEEVKNQDEFDETQFGTSMFMYPRSHPFWQKKIKNLTK